MSFISFFSLLFCLCLIPAHSAYSCNPSTCLPSENCYCASKSIPGGLTLGETPQFVVFTLDDSIYERDFVNPDCFDSLKFFLQNDSIKDSMGCHPRLSWYAMQTWTDPNMANYLTATGNLVNLHSFSHCTNTSTTAATWKLEEETVSNNLQKLGQIPKPIGSRAPFLQPNDAYLAQLVSMGVQFDSSYAYTPGAKEAAYWPFTLGSGLPNTTMCSTFGICPQKTYPELWEFIMNNFDYADSSNVMDPDLSDYAGQFAKFKQSFLNSYNSNRAPRGLYWHWRYLTTDGDFGGLDPVKVKFLTDFYRWVGSLPNVIFTTEDKIMNWMKNPVPYAETINLPDFQCVQNDPNLTPDNSCPQGQGPITCIYGIDQIRVCSASCPDKWPGMGVSWNFLTATYKGLTNAQLTHWTGTLALTNIDGDSMNFCADIKVTNTGRSKAVAFVFSLLSCPSVLEAWVNFGTGNSVSYFTKGTNKGFTILGSNNPDPSPSPNDPISIKAGSSVIIGGFCLEASTSTFSRSSNLVMGIDLYGSNVNCEINSCKKFCGDGVCSTGETSTTCPIDCKTMKCPTARRMLRGSS